MVPGVLLIRKFGVGENWKMPMTASARSNLVRLEYNRSDNGRVVPLKPKLAEPAEELGRALTDGCQAVLDQGHANFYEILLPSGWFYFHVHEASRKVYLVAFAGCLAHTVVSQSSDRNVPEEMEVAQPV